jgi:hypothetical protein
MSNEPGSTVLRLWLLTRSISYSIIVLVTPLFANSKYGVDLQLSALSKTFNSAYNKIICILDVAELRLAGSCKHWP